MTCDQCGQHWHSKACPCCEEVGVEFKTPLKATPGIYDIISWVGKEFVKYTATKDELLRWASLIGYEISGDDTEIDLRTANGRIDYVCLLQHDDYMNEYPRDEATELARWM